MTRCPYCGHVLERHESKHGKWTRTVVACLCGFGYTDETGDMTAEEIEKALGELRR